MVFCSLIFSSVRNLRSTSRGSRFMKYTEVAGMGRNKMAMKTHPCQ